MGCETLDHKQHFPSRHQWHTGCSSTDLRDIEFPGLVRPAVTVNMLILPRGSVKRPHVNILTGLANSAWKHLIELER